MMLVEAVKEGEAVKESGQADNEWQQVLMLTRGLSDHVGENIEQTKERAWKMMPASWVKPHKDGMIPVYGRDEIDYISFAEFDAMSRIVFSEAKTEDFEGKVAVAEVILNRVESGSFPDTIEAVIGQENAFSIYGASGAAPLDTECMEAVQKALNERALPYDVVYFREGHFHTFGTPYIVIGNHYFSRE